MVYKRTAALFLLIGISSLLVIGGCPDPISRPYKNTTGTDSGEPIVSSDKPDVQFADIPVPLYFSLVRERSYSHEEQDYRIGFLFYQGRGSVDEIANFYKEQMPLNNWEFISKDGLTDRITIKYVKEDEECTVTIDHPGRKKTTGN